MTVHAFRRSTPGGAVTPSLRPPALRRRRVAASAAMGMLVAALVSPAATAGSAVPTGAVTDEALAARAGSPSAAPPSSAPAPTTDDPQPAADRQRSTRPGNDDFGGSDILGADGSTPGSNVGATGQPGEPDIAGSPADTSVWYSWVAAERGETVFTTAGANFDTTIGVFTGASVDQLQPFAADDDHGASKQSQVVFHPRPGNLYRIAVDGVDGASGSFTLQWTQNRPGNDDLAGALTLPAAGGVVVSSNTRATREPGEPLTASNVPNRTLWWSWTPSVGGTVTLATTGSDVDTVLGVYTGGPDPGDLVAVAANNNAGVSPLSRVRRVPVTAGTRYSIVVDAAGSDGGAVRLQGVLNPPGNDDFLARPVLPGSSGSRAGTTVDASGEPGEPGFHGGAAADSSVWYRWTAPYDGPSVLRLRQPGVALSPGVEIYTGSSLATLTSVAETAGPDDGEVAFAAVAGTVYSIAIDGNGGSRGAFTLEWVLGLCQGRPATVLGAGVITGTDADDVIVGSTRSDTVLAGGGNDVVCGLAGDDLLDGGEGDDLLDGGPHADTLVGGNGTDDLNGDSGDDTARALAEPDGPDWFRGGTGSDTTDYSARSGAVRVSMNNLTNDGAFAEGDRHLGVENATGGRGDDHLIGSPGFPIRNVLLGNDGADTLDGSEGDDRLEGRAGDDVLTGGPGLDVALGGPGDDSLHLADGEPGDSGDGGPHIHGDTATADSGDSLVNVP